MNDETEKEETVPDRLTELEIWISEEKLHRVAQYILDLETKLEAGTI